ncbi:MAG: FecR domain-containing protein [Xanthomonadaceae bacterium]|nr:FecR domain-containing protein [Xanthomonadaceae bacterium]
MHGTTPTEIEASAAHWLARRDGTHWRAQDALALDAWLAADTRHRVAFLRLQAGWAQSGRLQALGAGGQPPGPPPRGFWQAPPSSRREQMLQAVTPATARRVDTSRRFVARLANVVLLAACALLVQWGWRNYTHVDVASYRTAMGEVRQQALTDGSLAILASKSRIDVRMARSQRDVVLMQGEAIFEVAKDRQRPFAVAVDGYRAVAVGTRFSVRRDAHDLRVVVTEGTVRLDSPDNNGHASPSSLLPAGSVALIHDGSVLVRNLGLAEVGQLLDWHNGWLVFRDTPLQDAVAEFNRYNARKLQIADPDAGALRIGGSFRWDNEDTFVRLLEAGFPIRAEASPGRIVLHSR